MTVPDLDKRDDVEALPVPQECMGYVAGKGGTSLYSVEMRTGTFCFISKRGDGKSESNDSNGESESERGNNNLILIFSTDEMSRMKAKAEIEKIIRKKTDKDRVSIRKFGGDDGDDGGRDDEMRRKKKRRRRRSSYSEGSDSDSDPDSRTGSDSEPSSDKDVRSPEHSPGADVYGDDN